MLLRELIQLDEKQVWAKRGQKIVRKFRCTNGPRAGRVVSDVGQCYAAPDIEKRLRLRMTKARLGGKMARKAKRTKRTNKASIAVRKLNK